MKSDYLSDFVEDGIYHVYNRTNNRELLFKTDENRLYFLRQFDKYLHPFLETFAWNLLPNHFHFLVRIKSSEEIASYLKSLPETQLKNIEKKYLVNEVTTSDLLVLQWKRFFNSYSMAFNKMYSRQGNLFYRPFKRVHVQKDVHFTQSIVYLHANAQKHKLCKDFRQHPWSSWHTMLSSSPTKLLRQEVLEWFGGIERFLQLHADMTSYYYEGDIE